MAQTLYASFADASLAEKAAGALLDYGVRNEDISLVTRDADRVNATDTERRDYTAHSATLEERRADTAAGTAYADTESGAINAGRATEHGTESVGDRIAEGGDRFAAGVSRTFGADATANRYDAAADQRAADANFRAAQGDTDVDNASVAGTNAYNRGVSGAYDTNATDVNRNAYTTTDTYADTDTDVDRDTNTTYVNHSTGAGDSTEMSAKQGLSTTTPGDAASGAAKGAAWGLGIGILAALASIAIPGFGLVAGGGALATAIGGAAGATAAGAISGGVYGYLKDQGVPDHVAVDYNKTYEAGGAILAVHVPSGDVDEATARELLNKYGASNVNLYGPSAMAA